MKRRYLVCILAILIIVTATVFLQSRHPKEKPAFWVITEKSNSDGMNLQLDLVIKELQEENPELEIVVEILPTEVSEREIRLQQVRTQIMAGNGPDVYLLPTGDALTTDEPNKGAEISITPLFSDVSQAMRNGLFADVSSYYDRDAEMMPEELNEVVMDAGCIGDKRYVLPLRYTVPILFLSSDEDYGDLDYSQMSAQSIVKTSLDAGNTAVACNVDLSKPFSSLPQLLDYEKGTVLISEKELTEYLRVYREWKTETDAYQEQLFREGNLRAVQSQDPIMQTMMSDNYYRINYESFGKLWCFLGLDVYWKTSGLPIYTGNMGNVLDLVAIKEALDEKVEMIPFRASDGSLFAEVTYFGAVGENTSYPEISYQLLSRLLGQEYQWDIYRPRRDASVSTGKYGKNDDPQSKGLVENSWPVRTEGAVPNLWDTYRYQLKGMLNPYVEGLVRAAKKMQNREFVLTEEDFPVLDWEISFARFPIVDSQFDILLDSIAAGEVTAEELSDRMYELLQWHLIEG